MLCQGQPLIFCENASRAASPPLLRYFPGDVLHHRSGVLQAGSTAKRQPHGIFWHYPNGKRGTATEAEKNPDDITLNALPTGHSGRSHRPTDLPLLGELAAAGLRCHLLTGGTCTCKYMCMGVHA